MPEGVSPYGVGAGGVLRVRRVGRPRLEDEEVDESAGGVVCEDLAGVFHALQEAGDEGVDFGGSFEVVGGDEAAWG